MDGAVGDSVNLLFLAKTYPRSAEKTGRGA